MEESLAQEQDSQQYTAQSIRFKTQIVSQQTFKISRQRSVSPLQIKDRTQSNHVKNVKEKHLMYKKDLLQERFQNLQANPNEQKKPFKLRLERVNKQNMVLIRELDDISNGLEIKFEAQNDLIKRSLQKMERIVSKSIHQRSFQRPESSKKIASKSKLELGPTENQKILQAKIDSINEEKNKVLEEIKGMKSVNQFLSNQNYKLSMENSMLKQRIVEYEQNDYDNALKSVEDSDSEYKQSIQRSENQDKQQNYEQQKIIDQQESIVLDRKLSKKVATQSEIQQKNTHEEIPDENPPETNKLISSIRKSIQPQPYHKVIQQCAKCQKHNAAAQEIIRLVSEVNNLEQELEQQRYLNETLKNKVALLKNQLSENALAKKQPVIETQMDSAISIKMDILKNQRQKNSEETEEISEQSSDRVNESKITPKPASVRYPHIVTKSNILSNQIIYFAEPIHQPKDKAPHKSKKKIEEVRPSLNKQNSDLSESKKNKIQGEGKESDNSDEKRKTSCLKKLQLPSLQVQKRRESIQEKLSNSVMTKGLNLSNSLSFYSNQKVHQLQIIRETISLKFEAFKYTFELFQNQMILWPNGKLNMKEVKSILSEYPFFLDETAIETLLEYCGIVEGKNSKIDKFCNKMKEFIGEYDEMTEEEELILEKKIYKRWKYTKDEVLELMKKNEMNGGEITKAKFLSVLEEFKFEEKEIHHLVSQAVAISSDINRIKYRQYLANFLAKK